MTEQDPAAVRQAAGIFMAALSPLDQFRIAIALLACAIVTFPLGERRRQTARAILGLPAAVRGAQDGMRAGLAASARAGLL